MDDPCLGKIKLNSFFYEFWKPNILSCPSPPPHANPLYFCSNKDDLVEWNRKQTNPKLPFSGGLCKLPWALPSIKRCLGELNLPFSRADGLGQRPMQERQGEAGVTGALKAKGGAQSEHVCTWEASPALNTSYTRFQFPPELKFTPLTGK